MHHNRRNAPARTLQARLQSGFGLMALLSLALCVGVCWCIRGVNREAAGLARQLTTETEPACRLDHEAETLAHQIMLFTRTHDEADYRAGLAQQERTAAMAEAESQLAATRGAGPGFRTQLKEASVELAEIRRLYENAAWQFRMTDRSTRGIASQASLLLTLYTQLLNNDGTTIPGELAPAYRPTLVKALNQIGDVQNATLFAHASVDPGQLDRGAASLMSLGVSLAELTAATPASELHDFLAECTQNTRDLSDELANLKKGLSERRVAVENLIEEIGRLRARLAPAVGSGVQTAVSTARGTTRDMQRLLLGVIAGSAIVTVAGFIAAAWLSARLQAVLQPISERLRRAAVDVSGATERATAEASGLADSAHTEAASLHQISSSAQQIAATAEENVGHVVSAGRRAEKTAALAAHGNASIAEMSDAMREIATTSAEIERTVGMIDEIAFQINLLSLNAAIEAARAGESGRGFAVVADEVRRLAQRSAGAARDTAAVIDGAKQASQRGVRATRQVEHDFASISREISEVSGLLQKTTAGSTAQAQEVQAMTDALRECEAATESSSGRADRVSGLATQLHERAIVLAEDAEALTRLVMSPPRRRKETDTRRAWGRGGEPAAGGQNGCEVNVIVT